MAVEDSGIKQSHWGPGDKTRHGIKEKIICPASHGTQCHMSPLKMESFGGPWRASFGKGSIILMMVPLPWQQGGLAPGGEEQRRDGALRQKGRCLLAIERTDQAEGHMNVCEEPGRRFGVLVSWG